MSHTPTSSVDVDILLLHMAFVNNVLFMTASWGVEEFYIQEIISLKIFHSNLNFMESVYVAIPLKSSYHIAVAFCIGYSDTAVMSRKISRQPLC